MKFAAGSFAGSQAARQGIKHHSAADGGQWGGLPNDEAVAGKDQNALLEAQLRERLIGWREFRILDQRVLDQCDFSHTLERAGMEVHLRTIFHFADPGKEPEFYIDPARGAKTIWSGQGHSALQVLVIDSGQVDGGTLASFGAVHIFSAGLHAADTQFCCGRKKLDFVFWGNLATHQCAGNYAAETFHRKGAIDRQAKSAAGIFSRD